jgi:hypothetical protein
MAPKVTITKSRSGHYTATVSDVGVKLRRRKLADLHRAQIAAHELSAQIERGDFSGNVL